MDDARLEKKQVQWSVQAWYVLFFLLIARLISMYFVPLNDSTEARYGEIARKMLETGNWVTPQIDYGVPFWAKPPLSTWMSALSMGFFGINEFAARLPALFLSFAILMLVWTLAKRHSNGQVAKAAVLILAGSLYFFLDAGTVMTDPSLLFCCTLSMVGFWLALTNKDRFAAYLFFIGLGLGLLAKGPVVFILVGLPLFFWVLLRQEWTKLWQALPWFQGLVIVGLIALPWYVLAEIRTPGFINYFIIGEHFKRFLVSGWTGDKYGTAHSSYWGMIWIYAVIGIFPWNLIGGSWLLKYWRRIPSLYQDEDGWMLYLLLWLFMPLVFFTFASNIIYPYVFPILPAYALLIAEGWQRWSPDFRGSQWLIRGSALCGLVFLMVTLLFYLIPQRVEKTQKHMVATWLQLRTNATNPLIYWEYSPNYSARFYAAGQVKSVMDLAGFCQLIAKKDLYLVLNEKQIADIPPAVYARGREIKKELNGGEYRSLIHFPSMNC